ncbi:MAG: ATP-binding protein, partial [Lachnospiraceae bacterium]|nr:ATP-binding protein [Lachnospiraceae bacterium]
MDKKFDHEQNQLARQNELLCKAREQAEQARLEAAEANKYMMLMLDATPLCCELWDANFNIIDCNSATVNFFNLNSKKEYMKRFCEFLPEYQPNGERSEEKIANCIQKALNEGSYSCEWTHMLSGGTLVPVEATFVPVINGKEMVTAIYFRDLRNDKAAERRMQESMERERNLEIQKQAAQAASNAKTQFLASMSHEIRTPMNAIIGMSDLLLSEDLNIRQHRYAEDIRISALALLAIINDILDLSKIQAAKLSLIPVHFLFEPLIDYISSMIIFLIKDNCKEDLDFHVNMPSEYPECLYGDDVRFRQILINVLGNAVKFTKAGSITLDINFKDEKMLISVTDTGIGIPKKDLPNLFDAFEQVDSQKNRHHQGTGLGLSITKSLVELMGGRISVESAYGEGSTFLIELPVVLGDKNLIRHEETTFEIVYAPQANVLVVDDRETNLNVVCGLLHHCKINADKALSGPIAIDKAHQKKYDLIFMDHMMPEMDG